MAVMGVLLLDEGGTHPHFAEDHGEVGEDGDHGERSKVVRRQKPGKDGGDDDLAHLLAAL